MLTSTFNDCRVNISTCSNRDKKQKTKKQKNKKTKTKQNQKRQQKKKKNDRLTQNFEVCYTSIRIFQALNVVLESGYSGHSLHIDTQHYFALRQFLFKKKKKKGCNPTNQSLRHLKTNTCIMLLYCSWGSDIAFRT